MSNYRIQKTEAQWREQLGEAHYKILREKGTERPFTGSYNLTFEDGTYCCMGCKNKLFESASKFDSGCGWPSFDREIKGNVSFDVDYNLGYARSEEHCATCGGHLGHVFNDGPRETTGKRHCINGEALLFKAEK